MWRKVCLWLVGLSLWETIVKLENHNLIICAVVPVYSLITTVECHQWCLQLRLLQTSVKNNMSASILHKVQTLFHSTSGHRKRSCRWAASFYSIFKTLSLYCFVYAFFWLRHYIFYDCFTIKYFPLPPAECFEVPHHLLNRYLILPQHSSQYLFPCWIAAACYIHSLSLFAWFH